MLAPGYHQIPIPGEVPPEPPSCCLCNTFLATDIWSRNRDGVWEERGITWAAIHPSSATGDPLAISVPAQGQAWSNTVYRCSHRSSLVLSPSLAGARRELLPRDGLLAWTVWVITRFGTLQTHGIKKRAPKGIICDSSADKRDLDLRVRAGKVLLLQQTPLATSPWGR